MNQPSLFLAAIVSSGVLLALSGCGKSPSQSAAEAVVATATGGKVQVSQSGDKSQMTIKDDKGNTVQVNSGGNVPLPKDFPSDVHLPANYTVKAAVTMPQGVMLELHSSATMASLYADYDSTMKSSGWTAAMAAQTSDKEGMFNFTKDKRNVVVALKGTDNGTDVHIQIVDAQK